MSRLNFILTSNYIECTFHWNGFDIATIELSFLPNVNDTIDFELIYDRLEPHIQKHLDVSPFEDELVFIIKERRFFPNPEYLSVVMTLDTLTKKD